MYYVNTNRHLINNAGGLTYGKYRGFTVIRMHGNKLKRDVIETCVATVKENKHPSIYPVEVVEAFLYLLTPADATGFRPIHGFKLDGCRLQKQLGRNNIGYVFNAEYCEYARQRVSDTPAAPLAGFAKI